MPSIPSCVPWIIVGVLVCGLAFSTVLTLYLRERSDNDLSTTTSSTSMNQMVATVSNQSTTLCEGISSRNLWGIFNTAGITMPVDTSSCNFNVTPLYFVSLGGTDRHWTLGGYTAIYAPTNRSFQVYGRSLSGQNNTLLLADAYTYKWDINWFAILK